MVVVVDSCRGTLVIALAEGRTIQCSLWMVELTGTNRLSRAVAPLAWSVESLSSTLGRLSILNAQF